MRKSISICLLTVLFFQAIVPVMGYRLEGRKISEEHPKKNVKIREAPLPFIDPQERDRQQTVRSLRQERKNSTKAIRGKQQTARPDLTFPSKRSLSIEQKDNSPISLTGGTSNLTVEIQAPKKNDSIVNSVVNIKIFVNASNASVTKVRLFRNNTTLEEWNATEWNTTSKTYAWDTTQVVDGLYNITLWAKDNETNTNSTMIWTIVSNRYWVEVGAESKGLYNNSAAGNLTYIYETYNLTDTIINLAPGVYNESTGESFPLNFTNYENVTLKGTSKTILNVTEKAQGIRVSTSNITFSGFTIHNAIHNATKAIYLSGTASNITLENLIIRGSETGIDAHGDNHNLMNNTITNTHRGVRISASKSTLWKNNVSYNNETGVLLKKGRNVTVKNNTISFNGEIGLFLRSTKNITAVNNTLRGNKIGFLVKGKTIKEYDHKIKDNYVNGNEAYYVFNKTNETFSDYNTSHFTFAFCEDITFKNSNITEGDFLRLAFTNNTTLNGDGIKSNFRGVRIEYSKNITVRGNLLFNNTRGISLISSKNITLGGNNTLKENTYGIYSKSLFNATISGNSFTRNNYSVYLTQSGNNTIAGNNISSVKYGIYLSSSHNNTITRNIMSSNKSGVYLKDSQENHFEKNNISDPTHGIYLKQATNNEFKENNLTNSRYGVFITSANENEFTKNNLTSITEYGIYLKDSQENHFEKNNISDPTHGIYLKQATNNEFKENNLHGGEGFHLEMADKNKIRNNNINVTGQYGIYFSSSNNNTVKENVIVANNTAGMYFSYSNWNTLEENQIRSGLYGTTLYGTMLYYSSDNQILRNNLTFTSEEDTIFLYYSNNVEITGNYLRKSEENGIYLDHSNSFKISKNEIMNNTNHGIYLYYSNNGEINDNEVRNNGKSGICAIFSRSLDIRGNNLQSNGKDGIYLYRASDNTVVRNTIIGNRYGVYLNHADNNLILRNQFKENSKEAIHKVNSTGNKIKGNEIPQEGGRWENYQTILITIILAVIGVGGLLLLIRSRKEEEEASS